MLVDISIEPHYIDRIVRNINSKMFFDFSGRCILLRWHRRKSSSHRLQPKRVSILWPPSSSELSRLKPPMLRLPPKGQSSWLHSGHRMSSSIRRRCSELANQLRSKSSCTRDQLGRHRHPCRFHRPVLETGLLSSVAPNCTASPRRLIGTGPTLIQVKILA